MNIILEASVAAIEHPMKDAHQLIHAEHYCDVLVNEEEV